MRSSAGERLCSVKWWIAIALFCMGCGGSNPVGTGDVPNGEVDSPGPEVSLLVIRVSELNDYLAKLEELFVPVTVIVNEYQAIAFDWGLVPGYWLEQFLGNLLIRVEAVQELARNSRPSNPELRRLHIEEFEPALAAYREGFEIFKAQHDLGIPSLTSDLVNEKLGEGNLHLIRLQILLSDLAGQDIVLGPVNPVQF